MRWIWILIIVWVVFESHLPINGVEWVGDVEPLDMLDCGENFSGVAGFKGKVFKGVVTLKRRRSKDSPILMGVAERNGEILSNWMMNKLGEFCSFLGLTYKGFEEEVLSLFRKIERRRCGMCPHDLMVD